MPTPPPIPLSTPPTFPGRTTPPNPAAPKSRLRTLATFHLIWIATFVTAWLIGQITRDRSLVTAWLFYIPSPAAAFACIVGAAQLAIVRKWRASAAYLFASLVPIAFVLSIENHWVRPNASSIASAPASAAEPFRIVHWNISRHTVDTGPVQQALVETGADFYALSEVRNRDSIEPLALRLGDGFAHWQGQTLGVVARGELRDVAIVWKNNELKIIAGDWLFDGNRLRFLFVDLPSNPLRERGPRLRHVVDAIRDEKPDFVVGDFNAPRRSRGLEPPPQGYRHAYEAAGAGWSYTWPNPIPMFALDQFLVGERLQPLRYTLDTPTYRDHRMQTLDFRILP